MPHTLPFLFRPAEPLQPAELTHHKLPALTVIAADVGEGGEDKTASDCAVATKALKTTLKVEVGGKGWDLALDMLRLDGVECPLAPTVVRKIAGVEASGGWVAGPFGAKSARRVITLDGGAALGAELK